MYFGIREPFPIDYRYYRLSILEYFRYLAEAVLLEAAVVYTFYRSFRLFLFLLPLTAVYPILLREKLKEKRQHAVLSEFQEALSVLSAYLGAGYSVNNAFREAQKDIAQVIGTESYLYREWGLILRGLDLNQPLERLLSDFSMRSGLDDIHNFSEVFVLAQRSGGSIPEILRSTVELIREKFHINEEIYTMSAAKRFEQKVMNFVPFLIIWYLQFSSPDFFSVLYEGFLGRGAMTACLGLYVLALVLAERILRIEV